jgi:hypothetical protein
MSLSPATTITLGSLRYDTHVANVVVRLAAIPGVNACHVTLPAGVEVEANPGDRGVIEMDGGEGSTTVLTGKVRSLQRRFFDIEAVVADASADLAALRPAVTYERQAARDVIRAVSQDAGVTTGTLDIDLPLAAYVADQGRTAAEHVALLARLAGALATVNTAGNLQVRQLPNASPDLALRHGREVIAYQVTAGPGLQARRVVVGNGPAGTPDAPNALRHSPDMLPGNAPRPGRDALWAAMPLLRTPAAALAASEAAERQVAATGSRVHARCFLLPQLRPGSVVEVQDLPAGLSGGPWLITHVRHQLKPWAGGVTIFEGVSAGAGTGLGGLLGAALSAAGGLL